MRVVLLKDIKGVGRKDDIKELSDGYVRNFLLPQRLAAVADEGIVTETKNNTLAKEKKRAAHITFLKEKAGVLGTAPFVFRLKVGDGGTTFGSVTAKDLQKELRKQGIEDAEILLEHAIKTTGVHPVVVNLEEGIQATISVEVLPS